MNYRSVATLNKQTIEWIPELPKDIDVIVGIPRSGMLVANLLSLYLNVPFTDVEGLLNSRIISVGKRCPIADQKAFLTKKRKVLVIDDSLLRGTQIKIVKEAIRAANLPHNIFYAAFYVAPGNEKMVDFFFETVPMPRVFEWNFLHHGDMDKWCVDIDGVLCRDPTDEENDDGIKYEHFLKSVDPYIVPTYNIGWLVTCRLEKYREFTERWLKDHNVRYNEFIMMNFPDKKSRIASGSHAAFKAQIYKKTGAGLFIESSIKQANEIVSLSGKSVFCTETMEMLNPGFIIETIKQPQKVIKNIFRKLWRRVRKITTIILQ
jgi:orotate phosphoribosyltransferase